MMDAKTMNGPTARNHRLTGAFLLGLALLYLAGVALVCMPSSPATRDVLVGYALPVDCMLVLPALFYVLVVRRNDLSPLLVLPVMWAGTALASFFAYGTSMAAIAVLGACALVVEVSIAIREAARFIASLRAAQALSDDALDWFVAPFMQITRSERASRLAANEFAMLYYALFSWKRPPRTPCGEAFTYHKNSGYSAFMAGMALVIPVETVAVHLLVSQWSAVAAWVLTALSLYAVLWLVADCRASVLRPIVIDGDTVKIRSGMRFSADIPLAAIASCTSEPPDVEKKCLVDLAMMGAERRWLVLAEPIEVLTVLGSRKAVRAIGVSVDDKTRFEQAMRRHNL